MGQIKAPDTGAETKWANGAFKELNKLSVPKSAPTGMKNPHIGM
jgi:hypothetical protein